MTSGSWQENPYLLDPRSEVVEGSERIELRDYQRGGLNEILRNMAGGSRTQVLVAPTGAGKTVIAAYILESTRQKGNRGVMVVDRVSLVDQTSAALWKFGVPHGLIQGARSFRTGSRVLVCSAMTLERRNAWPACDLLIVDECHAIRKGTTQFIQETDAKVIGLTATPFTRGLGDIYQGVVNVATTSKLIDDKWLVPAKIYVGEEINMVGTKKNSGEWSARDVSRQGQKIVGDILDTWVKKTNEHFGGPVPTLVFTADTNDGRVLCERFQEAGFDFRQSTYKDDAEETQAIVEAFKRDEFTGLVSVDKFAKGFDHPGVLCLILARPFSSSFAAHLQQLGRGLRPAPGKEFCLVLDHSGNCLGFAYEARKFFQEGAANLDLKKKRKVVRKEGAERPNVVCRSCGFVLESDDESCPACGVDRRRRGNATGAVHVPGRMREFDIGLEGGQLPKAALRNELSDKQEYVWREMSKIGVARHGNSEKARSFAVAQYREFFGAWPPKKFGFNPNDDSDADPMIAMIVTAQVADYVKKRGWTKSKTRRKVGARA